MIINGLYNICLLLGISLGLASDYLLGLPFEYSKAQVYGLMSVDQVNSCVSVGPWHTSDVWWNTPPLLKVFHIFHCLRLFHILNKVPFVFPLQTFISPHYGLNLVLAYIIMMLTGVWAFFVSGGSCRSLKLCLLCQDKDFLLFNQRAR